MGSNKIVPLEIGKRYGKLVILGEGIRKDKCRRAFCKCDCGNELSVHLNRMVSGKTTSCGCFRKGVAMSERKTRHGLCHSRIYRIHRNMHTRCYRPNCNCYDRYGGRGIRVCAEWKSFPVFYEWAIANGYADNLTIDRINVDGNYEPVNCRWLTQQAQCLNTSQNKFIEFDGKKQTIVEWERELGFKTNTIWNRLKRGYTAEQALLTPINTVINKRLTYNWKKMADPKYLTPKEIWKETGITPRSLKYGRKMKYLKEFKWSPGRRVVYYDIDEVKKVYPNAKIDNTIKTL